MPQVASDRKPLLGWPCVMLVVGIVLAYLPAMIGDFIWDDDVHVSNNFALRSLRGLGWIWTRLGTTPQYYPLTHTTFWVQYQVWGANPIAYHVGNILLHTGSALLLWWILARLRVPGSYLAALLFAWHPVQVESVAWISERKNTLSTFLYLCALVCAIRAFGSRLTGQMDAEVSRRPHFGWYAGLILCALAAVLSKTVAGTLPAALMLVAWWKRGRVDWRLAAWLTPLWVMAAVFSRITSYMEREVVGAAGPEWQFTFVDRCLIAGRAVVFYVGKLLVPIDLTFIYPRWTIDVRDPKQWAFPLIVVATGVLLFVLRNRIGRGPLAATAFFVVTVFPALGFVNIYPMRFSFVADHFQYLAGVGVFVLVAAGLSRIGRQGVVAWGLAAILLPMTFLHAQAFASQDVLWHDVLRRDPGSVIARTRLAELAVQDERYDEAETLFRQALAIEPEQSESLIGLSNILLRRGDHDGAVALAREAVRVRPNRIRTWLQLATLLQSTRPDEAIAAYRHILDIDARFEPARIALAKLLALGGHIDDAIAECQRAIEIFPEGIQARALLGDLYINLGDKPRARAAYEAALAIEPDNEALRRRIATAGS